MPTRRQFLESAAVAPLALNARQGAGPKRIAIVCTVYRYLSHAQHMGDRFLIGYPYGGKWHKPDIKVVSLYVDQKSDIDLSGARAKEFGFTIYPTIAETLRCGGKRLAVDAVLTIGEHGNYPRNAKGQVLYPRYEFFEECRKVFEEDGRAVPYYNDKNLSYSFEKAKKMVDASHALKFPMLAGSSLPVASRFPDIELPLHCEIEDALMVGYGGSDGFDYHSLEGMQCMVERRKGGESGVKAVQMITGDAVWKAADEGRYSKELLTAALSRSDTLGWSVADGQTRDLVADGELPKLVRDPAAYFIEYRDGLKATLLMLNGEEKIGPGAQVTAAGAIMDYNFAARVKGNGVLSTQFFLSPNPNVTYSGYLVNKIEQMFSTGVAPYPVQRTLIVSGILESCLTSKVEGQKRLETPHLSVAYQAPVQSQYYRI